MADTENQITSQPNFFLQDHDAAASVLQDLYHVGVCFLDLLKICTLQGFFADIVFFAIPIFRC